MSCEGYSSIALEAEAAPRRGPFRWLVGNARNGKWSARTRLSALIFLVWTAVGVFESVPEMLINSPWPVLLAKVIDSWAWALITLALLPIDRKFASTEQSIAALALKFLLLSIPFSLAHLCLGNR